MRISLRSPIVVAAAAVTLSTMTQTAAAQTYAFTKVADSAAGGSDPLSFGCAAINGRSDVAFRAGRLASDGFNTTPGIYRANADGTITTIAEDRKRFAFIGFNPSLNGLGQVSFAARIDGGRKPDTEAILRGDGRKLTTIASTADRFNFFGFDTSINDVGDVAFLASLDDFTTTGIFVGPDPVADRVIATGDTLDGSTITNLTLCKEGLSDSGELAVVAMLDDSSSPDGFRTAVFRATAPA